MEKKKLKKLFKGTLIISTLIIISGVWFAKSTLKCLEGIDFVGDEEDDW